MDTQKAWEVFEQTGLIKDYLNYREAFNQPQNELNLPLDQFNLIPTQK